MAYVVSRSISVTEDELQDTTILIIDDNVELLDLLGDWFENSGYQVGRCEDADQARAWCLNQKPDFVLCDMTLPRINGLALVQQLREMGLSVPIFLMSGGSDPDAETLRRCGADGFFPKPFRPTEVQKKIEHLSCA